jgi:exopolysaccharide production protein ExoQ
MTPSIATVIFACGIAGLFYLDREARASKALWLPIVWFWLIASRSLSAWIGLKASANVQLEGSPLDAAVFGILLVAAVVVLARRGQLTRRLLAANWPILIYFAYCLVSVSWSYYPEVSGKRWIKAIGDFAMALVVATEPRLPQALGRLYSRVGFLLLPSSVLLIKYYGEIGRGYTPDGEPMNTGVTTSKNMLGLIVVVVSLAVVWRVIALFRDKNQPNRLRHLVAQSVLLGFCIWLLQLAHSATSVACFLLGSTVIVMANMRLVRKRPAWLHALSFVMVLVGASTLFSGGEGAAVQALGRSSLSGRTEIWAAVIPAMPNAVVGAGFESFWITPACRREIARHLQGWWHPEYLNESHNGYLEVYLNLGWVGVFFLLVILIKAYKSAITAFRSDAAIGGLLVAYTIVAIIYNLTEAAFRMLHSMWVCLLVTMVISNGIAGGLIGGGKPRFARRSSRRSKKMPASDAPVAEGPAVMQHHADSGSHGSGSHQFGPKAASANS